MPLLPREGFSPPVPTLRTLPIYLQTNHLTVLRSREDQLFLFPAPLGGQKPFCGPAFHLFGSLTSGLGSRIQFGVK